MKLCSISFAGVSFMVDFYLIVMKWIFYARFDGESLVWVTLNILDVNAVGLDVWIC